MLVRIPRRCDKERTPPKEPGDDDIIAANFPENTALLGYLSLGREAQSMTFFSAAGREPLYSGEAIKNTSLFMVIQVVNRHWIIAQINVGHFGAGSFCTVDRNLQNPFAKRMLAQAAREGENLWTPCHSPSLRKKLSLFRLMSFPGLQ